MVALVNQLTAGGQFPHEDCGESCVASILIDAGQADSVLDIEHYDLEGGSVSGGTSGQVHVDRLHVVPIAAYIDQRDLYTVVSEGKAAGNNRWMAAITSNSYGTPYAGPGCVGHWVLVYDFDGSTYSIMQPVGGVPQQYPRAELEAAQQFYHVNVDQPIGVRPEDEPMTTAEKTDLGRCLTKLVYMSLMHRAEESQAAEDYWAAQMAGGPSFIDGLNALLASNEVQTMMAKDRARDVA